MQFFFFEEINKSCLLLKLLLHFNPIFLKNQHSFLIWCKNCKGIEGRHLCSKLNALFLLQRLCNKINEALCPFILGTLSGVFFSTFDISNICTKLSTLLECLLKPKQVGISKTYNHWQWCAIEFFTLTKKALCKKDSFEPIVHTLKVMPWPRLLSPNRWVINLSN